MRRACATTLVCLVLLAVPPAAAQTGTAPPPPGNQRSPQTTAGARSLHDRLLLLLASLTRGDWRALGSPAGLGLGDLTPEQRAIFLSLLPDPFSIREGHVQRFGSSYYLQGETVSFTAEERAQVRLRLRREVRLVMPEARDAHTARVFAYLRPEGTRVWVNQGYSAEQDPKQTTPLTGDEARALRERIGQQPLRHVAFPTDTPVLPGPELLRKLEVPWRRLGRIGGATAAARPPRRTESAPSFRDLSPEQQALVGRLAEPWREQNPANPLSPEAARPEMYLRLSFVVPGYGEVETISHFHGLEAL